MIEDFAATLKSVQLLNQTTSSGLTVQVHAGDIVDDGSGTKINTCTNGDTNALAAFLVAAGDYSYYHCAAGWGSNAKWPAVADAWLDWLPE